MCYLKDKEVNIMAMEQYLEYEKMMNNNTVSNNKLSMEEMLEETDKNIKKGMVLPIREVFAYFDELVEI